MFTSYNVYAHIYTDTCAHIYTHTYRYTLTYMLDIEAPDTHINIAQIFKTKIRNKF